MAYSVTIQTSPANGITEIKTQLVAAGWTTEATANPLLLSGVNYHVLKSASGSNAIGQNYYVMLYSPTSPTNHIGIELFETYNTTGPKKQHWTPNSSQTPDGSGRVNIAEQDLNYTATTGVCGHDCGSGSYTLFVKATIDYVVIGTQNNVATRRCSYTGSYNKFSWNDETHPLMQIHAMDRQPIDLGNGGGSFLPSPSGMSTSSRGCAFTRERYPNTFYQSFGTLQNFIGAWQPIKSRLMQSHQYPVSTVRDVWSTANCIAMDILIYKGTSYTAASNFREALFGRPRDMYDIGGAGGGNVGDPLYIGSDAYRNCGSQTGVLGDLYVKE